MRVSHDILKDVREILLKYYENFFDISKTIMTVPLTSLKLS